MSLAAYYCQCVVHRQSIARWAGYGTAEEVSDTDKAAIARRAMPWEVQRVYQHARLSPARTSQAVVNRLSTAGLHQGHWLDGSNWLRDGSSVQQLPPAVQIKALRLRGDRKPR